MNHEFKNKIKQRLYESLLNEDPFNMTDDEGEGQSISPDIWPLYHPGSINPHPWQGVYNNPQYRGNERVIPVWNPFHPDWQKDSSHQWQLINPTWWNPGGYPGGYDWFGRLQRMFELWRLNNPGQSAPTLDDWLSWGWGDNGNWKPIEWLIVHGFMDEYSWQRAFPREDAERLLREIEEYNKNRPPWE